MKVIVKIEIEREGEDPERYFRKTLSTDSYDETIILSTLIKGTIQRAIENTVAKPVAEVRR